MKRLISGVLILKISYIILVCHALNCDQPTNNNIRLSWSDPRLFVYDDSIFINRYLIDSMLKNMCEKHNNKADSVLIPVGNMAISHDRFDDIFIIVLANQFVRDGELKVPLQSYPPILGGYIRKGDLCKLYRSFLGVTYIEAKDIIDIVNLNKKFNCMINK